MSSSEDKDALAKKKAGNAAPRASKPGVVAVAADEAARLDQRIADKREKADNNNNNNIPPSMLKPAPGSSDVNIDRDAKQRSSSSTPATKPGAYAAGVDTTSTGPSTQLESFERDVAAKIRSSQQPGARAVSSDNDAVNAKVSRSMTAGSTTTSSPTAELAHLENAVLGKVRTSNVPAATIPGAVAASSSLQGMEDSIAAKVRRNDSDASASATAVAVASPGAAAAHGHLQTMEDSIAAKIRRESEAQPGAATAVGTASARLQSMEDSIAAKVRNNSSSSTPAVAVASSSASLGPRTELGNLEDSVAYKIRGADGTGGGAPGAARMEWNHGQESTTALSELQGLERHVVYKADDPPPARHPSTFESDLTGFEYAVRSKENVGLQHSEDVAKSQAGASNGLDKNKSDFRPEQALDKDDELSPQGRPEAATALDHGTATSPDLEYGMMGAGAGEGLAVAVAVEEEEDDMFIPSAVEYDPDAKPPLYKNRRFRLYAFLAFFIIVVVVVGATVAATLGKSKGTPAPTSAPTAYRESFGLASSIERVFGEDLLEDPNSPYAKALQWMTFDDPLELIPSNSSNFIQRFTAVYMYYATTVGGPWRSCNPPDNPRTDSSICTYQKLTFLFPEQFDLQPSHAWLSNTHECEWAGIVCDDQKQIRSIDLGT